MLLPPARRVTTAVSIITDVACGTLRCNLVVLVDDIPEYSHPDVYSHPDMYAGPIHDQLSIGHECDG